jgi:hypothetical protein
LVSRVRQFSHKSSKLFLAAENYVDSLDIPRLVVINVETHFLVGWVETLWRFTWIMSHREECNMLQKGEREILERDFGR